MKTYHCADPQLPTALTTAQAAPQERGHHASTPHPTGLPAHPIPCKGPEKMREKRGQKAARPTVGHGEGAPPQSEA